MVSVLIKSELDYCYEAPFYPPKEYLELNSWQTEQCDETNMVYDQVRNLLVNMGLDAVRVGTDKWNPLAEKIKPGNRVVIKPNLVMHHNHGKEDISAVVTHASVLRPIIDYCLLALAGSGEIIVGDAPQANANFETVVSKNGLRKMIEWYQAKGVNIQLVDFRKNWYPNGFTGGIKEELLGDPNGYVEVDLGNDSLLDSIEGLDKLYGSEYDRKFIVSQHYNAHKYLLSGSVLKADVIISVPKLKTHRKAGVTINAKNMVGANGDKNYLAHYRVGCKNGGDEYPPTSSLIKKFFYKWDRIARDYILVKNTMCSRYVYKILNKPFVLVDKLYSHMNNKPIVDGFGDWYGNDTVWRMCLDLNQIVLFADKDGKVHDTRQRQYLSFVDGIIAGEGDGPMYPTPKQVGFLAFGLDTPFETDYVAAYMMGFDPEKLKICNIKHEKFNFDKDEIDVICVRDEENVNYRDVNLHFMPQHNWVGHVERE